jgi:hypothetical protein
MENRRKVQGCSWRQAIRLSRASPMDAFKAEAAIPTIKGDKHVKGHKG